MRNASLAVVLLACLAVGCTPGGGSSAACGQGAPTVEPERARPGEAFVFRGVGFGGGCDDSNLPFRPDPPQKGVRIEMRQEGKTWGLATLDASGPPDYIVKATLEVPDDAEPGRAPVVAANAEGVDPAEPLDVPFEVLTGGAPPEAEREPAGTASTETGDPSGSASNGGRGEQGASGVATGSATAYACAPRGAPPVDLAVEGTVWGVRAGPGFSLAEIRVERVLEGDAGDTVFVRTNSGTRATVADDVVFEEGARYRLGLRREDVGRGDVYSTNYCLGKERLE